LSRFRKKPLPADERSDQISGDFNVALEEELKTESKAVVPKKAVSKKAVSKKAVPKKAVSKKAVPKKAPIKK
jgi:hypothetical protein